MSQSQCEVVQCMYVFLRALHGCGSLLDCTLLSVTVHFGTTPKLEISELSLFSVTLISAKSLGEL